MNKIVNDLALDAGFSKRSDDSDDLIYSPYKEEYDITEELGTWNVTMEPRPTFRAWMTE